MWAVNSLTNKLLKMDEEDIGLPVGNRSRLAGSCDTILPRSHFVEVPHVHQLCNWDCGLACVLMVLRTLGVDHCDIHLLGKLCSTTSIWTVDLAYLLHKFSVSFSFLTVTLGANPKFSVETFYKEQLPDDLGRVDGLFQKALEAGINIECRSISSEEISVLILSGKYIAVALVDKYKLSACDSCKKFINAVDLGWRVFASQDVMEELQVILVLEGRSELISQVDCILWMLLKQEKELVGAQGHLQQSGQLIASGDLLNMTKRRQAWRLSFTSDVFYLLEDLNISICPLPQRSQPGHYVVICGYDADVDEFEIRDPASSRKCERVSLECLEEARKSFGTDEDILLVSLEREGVETSSQCKEL